MHVNTRELTNLFGTTHANLKKLFEKYGIEPATKQGKENLYELKPIIKAWVDLNTTKVNAKLDRNVEDARYKAAQADKVEMQNKVRKNELMEKAKVEAEVTDILSLVKNKLLALPDSLTTAVFGLEDRLETRAVIKKRISESLEELAKLSNETSS